MSRTVAQLKESRSQTRTRLLESAAQSFARHGYVGASVDLVAEEAGYSKGAFYSNFESKEAIFLELMESFYQREAATLRAILAEASTPKTLLSKIKGFYTDLEMEIDWGLLSAEFQMQAARDAAFAKSFTALFNSHRDMLSKLLRELYQRVGRESQMETKELANLLMGMAVGLALQRVGTGAAPRRGFHGEAILFVLRDLQP